ncbi:MAG: DnaB-like helicase N-terminal domain-containing protein [Thermodesulfobacteriota bacterium]
MTDSTPSKESRFEGKGISQPLPQNIEAEQTVLGAILIESKSINQILDILTSEDFYETRNQVLFRFLSEMNSQGIQIDIAIVHEELKTKGLLEQIGEFRYLSYLTEIVVSTANVQYFANKVKETSKQRKLWKKSENLTQAILNGANEETINQLINDVAKCGIDTPGRIINLALQPEPPPRKWILQHAIPYGFPSTIYGDGGLGKSYLGLFFATLAAIGGERFLGLKFHDEPLRTLYLDFELDEEEFTRRAFRIARGLGLSRPPENLFYLQATKSLYKLLPQLKSILISQGIQLLIIDSLGAACVDPEKVLDVIEIFTELKNFRIATLVLDHQSKMQANDKYHQKTPYGSVYKYNLSRSVFQLSRLGKDENRVSLMLRHTKSNFGTELDDLIFDISFEGDRVIFLESKALSPEEKEMIKFERTGSGLNN